MIVIGYPCIGKSTYAVGHPYRAIDLESSNFVKDDNWVESYCNVAIDLSRQGHVVFVSSHDAVRKQLLKSDYEYVFVIYPALDIKEEWLERLHERYLETELEKDYRAWQRALNYYDEDIAKLEEKLASIERQITANATNSVKLRELMEKQENCATELEEKEERWMYLNELAEQMGL